MTKVKVLLFTKQTSWCEKVGEFCKRNFDTTWIQRDKEYNYILLNNRLFYDYIISYLSPWILPKEVLDKAKIAAINFHPGPPKYPGIGGYNFALYNGDKKYGVVAHLMEEKVDIGKIFACKYFSIQNNETVETLKDKSMNYLLTLFYEVIDLLEYIEDYAKFEKIYDWEREPYTRKDLQELCNGWDIVQERDYDFERWYNACYFPNASDKPHLNYNGKKYYIIREDHYDKTVSGWKFPPGYWNPT